MCLFKVVFLKINDWSGGWVSSNVRSEMKWGCQNNKIVCKTAAGGYACWDRPVVGEHEGSCWNDIDCIDVWFCMILDIGQILLLSRAMNMNESICSVYLEFWALEFLQSAQQWEKLDEMLVTSGPRVVCQT